jgi:predicted  nucleic acid-binding Zn-ribbon protein
MINLKDMYKVKKKRAVDPNAPPRPNLLSHEKVLKDTKLTIEQQDFELNRLRTRIEELEHKMANQTRYLNALHQNFQALKRQS